MKGNTLKAVTIRCVDDQFYMLHIKMKYIETLLIYSFIYFEGVSQKSKYFKPDIPLKESISWLEYIIKVSFKITGS